jgi:hypothetical protein
MSVQHPKVKQQGYKNNIKHRPKQNIPGTKKIQLGLLQ